MTNQQMSKVFKKIEKKKAKTIAELVLEKELELKKAHTLYKKGEIKFKELEPLINEYRELFGKYLKETGDIGI